MHDPLCVQIIKCRNGLKCDALGRKLGYFDRVGGEGLISFEMLVQIFFRILERNVELAGIPIVVHIEYPM